MNLTLCSLNTEVVIVASRTRFSRQEVALRAARFDISPVFSKEKAFADIYSNDSFVRSIKWFNGEGIQAHAFPVVLQQASYHMAPRALSQFITLGRFVTSCHKLASALVAMW